MRAALAPLVRQPHALDQEIARSDRSIAAMARGDKVARRLMTVPGLGPVTASARAANVPDVSTFSGPREFAAFVGLTPRQHSSGGKERLGRISKMGNRYLRKLLVVGAHAVLYHRKPHHDALRSWAKKLIQTKPFKLVAVALATGNLAVGCPSANAGRQSHVPLCLSEAHGLARLTALALSSQ